MDANAKSKLTAFLQAIHGNVQLLVTDVDGTLLDPDHNLTERTATALHRLQNEYKIPIIFATGKTLASTKGARRRLSMHSNKSCFSINVNGLVIHDDEGTVVSNKTLEKDIVLKVLETCRKRGYPSVVYSGHHIITSEDNPLAQCLPSYHESACDIRPDLERAIKVGEIKVNKVLVMADPSRLPEVRADLEKTCLSGGGAEFTQAVADQLELLPSGENKARALKRVCDMLNVDMANVIACGDGENDKEMLAAAGLGCAMGNASRLALQAADLVLPSNTENGLGVLAEALIEYLSPK